MSSQPIRIVILPRGWVFVGRVIEESPALVLGDAACIRRWGTTQGLGELAPGPTRKTVLDKAGTVRVPAAAVLFTMDCDQYGWDDALGS